MVMGRSAGGGKTGVVEEGPIGDESVEARCQYVGNEYKPAMVEVE